PRRLARLSGRGGMSLHHLPAAPETVHWGYFDASLAPVLTVANGDLVRIEALTHHAGDAPDLLMDDAIERVFDQVGDRGPGPHLLTGPIAVAGARPGDVLAVDILAGPPLVRAARRPRRQHRQLAYRRRRADALPGSGARGAPVGRRPARVPGRRRDQRHGVGGFPQRGAAPHAAPRPRRTGAGAGDR